MGKPKVKLDEFHYHEALDRTSMICDILEMQVASHPVFAQHKDLKKLLDGAIDSLYAVYSKVGEKIIDREDAVK